MADTASRPAQSRGPRGSARGGRGGSRAGGRFGNRQSNGDLLRDSEPADDFTDHGELGELKKEYGSSLIALRELFPDWTDADLLFALQETQGDLTSTVERISEGHVSKFADVKHHKERAPKAKVDRTTGPSTAAAPADGKPTRAGRGDSVRGGRSRGDRGGRGGSRGGRGGHATNGDRTLAAGSVPTPSDGWESSADILANEANKEESSAWTNVVTAKDTPAAASEGAKPSLLPENSAPAKKTWAQMFAKPIAPITPKASASASVPTVPAAEEPVEPNIRETSSTIEQEETPVPQISDEADSTGSYEMVEASDAQAEETPALEITPSQEPLTQENVSHLPDTSNPAPTGTEASTVDSTRAADSAAPSVLNQPIQQPPIGRPGLGGFATSALKATSGSGTRSASFQRRILDQQESVVMPGSRDAVGSTALQFGSLGLNGEAEDIDDEREEPETRAAPQPSPPSQPRATLPPASRQAASAAESAPEPVQQQQQPQAIKPAPGLPPAPQQQTQQQSPSASNNSHYMSQQGSQANQGYGQYGRYGQSGMPTDTTASANSKPYDAFGQQAQSSAYDGFSHGQQQGAYSSAASNDYSSYYTADQRNAYQNYYGSGYGQGYGSQQDSTGAQRNASNYGQGSGESGYQASQTQQNQGRYNDTQSGHNTPAPSNATGQQTGSTQGQQHSHLNQQAHSQNQHTGYPGYGGYGGAYGNRGMDYYNMQQYGNYAGYGGASYGQQGYGGAFGKGMHGGPYHGYGMSPQSGYDQHSASPAARGQDTYSQQSHGRDSALSGGLGDYTRSGSTQPSQGAQQSSNTSAYGGMHDVFGRGSSGYQGQNQQYGQQTGSAQEQESLKAYGADNKSATSGPNTNALGGQPGRPGSATNSALPPPQSQQHAGFSQGYPGQQTSQYGGLGGFGGNQQQQQQQGQQQSAGNYGAYNSFGNYSQGTYGRGGWGGSYGH